MYYLGRRQKIRYPINKKYNMNTKGQNIILNIDYNYNYKLLYI